MRKSSIALAVLLASIPAWAQPDGDTTAEPEPEPAPEPAPEPESDDDDDDDDEMDINLGGRVFLRDTITKLAVPGAEVQNDFGLESVRGNIDLRAYDWLRTSIEISFETDGEIDVEDVYLQVDVSDELRLEAGRFKRPMSPIALESPWSLPNTERGILSDDVEVGDLSVPLGLGGRADGAMISYKGDYALDPRVYVGVFNAQLPDPGGGDSGIAGSADNLLRDVYSRATAELIDGFEVGGSFAVITRARTASRLQSKFMGSLDLTFESDAFRAWLEGFAGNSTVFDGVESIGTLLGARLLLAPRFEDLIPRVERLEPFVIVSALDPTDVRDNNRAVEVGGGVAVWFRDLIRFQADYTYNAYEDQFPSPTFSIVDRSTIRLQLSSQFR